MTISARVKIVPSVYTPAILAFHVYGTRGQFLAAFRFGGQGWPTRAEARNQAYAMARFYSLPQS